MPLRPACHQHSKPQWREEDEFLQGQTTCCRLDRYRKHMNEQACLKLHENIGRSRRTIKRARERENVKKERQQTCCDELIIGISNIGCDSHRNRNSSSELAQKMKEGMLKERMIKKMKCEMTRQTCDFLPKFSSRKC